MDRIYSRPRIKIPKIKLIRNGNSNPKKRKKFKIIILIYLTFFLLLRIIFGYIYPMFETMCYLKAKGIAAEIVNKKTKESIEKVNYEDLITIVRNTEGSIVMVKANVLAINKIATELTIDIQEELRNKEQTIISIPFGSVFGNQLLYNIGPKIPVKINPVRNSYN